MNEYDSIQSMLSALIREFVRVKVIIPVIEEIERRQPPPWMALRDRWAQKDGRPTDSKRSRRC